jgi:hypothetical protein
MPLVSPRLALLNLALLGVAGYFGFELMRELATPRPLPTRAAARPATAAAPGAEAPVDPAARPSGAYGVVASRNLFSPSRTDVGATNLEATAAAAPRPILHGVVLDDAKSRAYLEDVATKRIFGYAVGDVFSGGKITAIHGDRVVLARPEGSIDVLLRDPSKPAPAPVALGSQPGLQPGLQPGFPPGARPGIQPPIRPGLSPATPGVPGTVVPGRTPSVLPPPTAAPRPLQSIPSDFLRRPTVAPPEASGR